MLECAVDLVRTKVISSYEAEEQFGIPRRTIVNKSKNIHNKSFGRPTELSTEEEAHIAGVVKLSAEFGCPLTLLDLRIVCSIQLHTKKFILLNSNLFIFKK